jgi:hypothetical protein
MPLGVLAMAGVLGLTLDRGARACGLFARWRSARNPAG